LNIALAVLPLLLFLAAVCIFNLPAQAAPNAQINYQGKLTNAAGTAVTDGDYNFRFRLCTASVAGACSGSVVFDETYIDANKVAVTSGLFSVMLGSVSSTLDTVNFNQTLYLEVQVGGTGVPAFETLSPCKILGSVPSSFTSLRLDGAASSTMMDISEYLIVNGNSTTTGYTSLATTTIAFDSKIGDLSSNYLTIEDYSFLTGTYVPTAGTIPLISFSSPNFSMDPTSNTGGFKDNFVVFQDSVSANPFIRFISKDVSDSLNAGDISYSTTTHTFSFTQSFPDFPLGTPVSLNVEDNLTAASIISGKIDILGGDPVVVGGADLALPALEGGSISEKIVGNYLYMVFQSSTSTDILRIIDISDSDNPVVIGGENLDFNTTGNGGARAIDVVGKYAYIGFENPTFSEAGYNFKIVDVSNPSNPIIIDSPSLSFSASLRAIKVVGKYAYIAEYSNVSDSGLKIVDISDPYQPRVVSPVLITGLTGESRSLDVSGNYAYLLSYRGVDVDSTNVLRIINISDPTNPVVVGGDNLSLPLYGRKIQVIGRYAYATFDSFGAGTGIDNGLNTDEAFRIINISDPTNPVVVGGDNLDFSCSLSGGGGLKDIFVADGLAYVTEMNNTFHVLDVSSSTNPTILKTISSSIIGMWPIVVSGNYAYVGFGGYGNSANVLRVYDLKGLKTGTANIGALKIGSLNAEYDLITAGNIFANGLNVGVGGITTDGNLSVNSTTTPSYFGGQVGIGTTTPWAGYELAVSGDAILTGGLTVSGNVTTTNLAINANGYLKYNNINLAFASTTLNNYFFGNAGNLTMTGESNIAIGNSSLKDNTTGIYNTAVGGVSLLKNTEGNANTAFGLAALLENTTGDNNTAIGLQALFSNQTGSGNVAIGYLAGEYETGSNSFYVDNQGRGSLAGEKAGALLYGVFDATPANQHLTINASTTIAQNLTVRGTATSTMAGNLDVAGNIEGSNVYTGDLHFANGWIVTEAEKLGRDYSGLVFFDSVGNEVIALNAEGEFIDPTPAAAENDLAILQEADPTSEITIIDDPDANLNTLVVRTAANFYGTLTVIGEANFISRVYFRNQVYFDKDSAGRVEIPINSSSTHITYSKPYAVIPVVTVSPADDLGGYQYWTANETTDGFDIVFATSATKVLKFNWHAIAVASDDYIAPSLTPPEPIVTVSDPSSPSDPAPDLIVDPPVADTDDNSDTPDEDAPPAVEPDPEVDAPPAEETAGDAPVPTPEPAVASDPPVLSVDSADNGGEAAPE